MVWICIALSIPVLILLLLHFLRFHFNLSVETPSTLRGSVGVSFFRFRREVTVDAAHAVMGRQAGKGDAEDEDGEIGGREEGAWTRNPNFKATDSRAIGSTDAGETRDPEAGQNWTQTEQGLTHQRSSVLA